ncbi:GNAT family N-acetyltransferase [Paenibacillus peoriae]|uniref:GNAT family N-acetyltransferase n=1 Tax=Paenibacillus peoriae TaxID=59893 RepID=UPI0007617ED8|nr:GNAT family N-acetyltransferase [Paenibacillus peoriae]
MTDKDFDKLLDIFDLRPSSFKYTPLQRVNDVAYEESWQQNALLKQGYEIVHSAQTKHHETVIVFRPMRNNELDDTHIILKARIISTRGIKPFSPRMFLVYDPDDSSLDIADIQVDVTEANKGYGSIFMAAMFKLFKKLPAPVTRISGWLSPVDAGHLDRAVHFYEKHGFTYHSQKNEVIWVKPDGE